MAYLIEAAPGLALAVEVRVVGEPRLLNPSEVRRVDGATESVRAAETGIVDQHDQDVRRALGCLHRFRELWGVGLQIGAADIALEPGIGPGQDLRSAGGLGWLAFFGTGASE